MKQNLYLSNAFVGAVALLILGGLGAYWPTWVGANGSEDQSRSSSASLDVVADAMTYQGYLTDSDGEPLTGSYTMRFEIYNATNGGSLLWDSGDQLITVQDGLFDTRFAIEDDIFNGEELWLAQTIEGELLSPRQELLPAPMAHTLRPGAIIKGTASAVPNNYTLEVRQNNDTFGFNRGAIAGETTTGNAIYGLATNGRAIYGQTQDGYGVYGFDGGSNANQGYGGYFYSTNGIGVYGYSGADRSHPNIYAPGVYGQSNQGVGVYGRGDTSDSHSFYNQGGYFEGGKGIYARGTDSSGELGYGAQIYSSQYRGMYVQGSGSFFDAYFGGEGGISAKSITDRAGRSQTIVFNAGSELIQTGDFVVMAGIVPSPEGGDPLLAVEKIDSDNQKAVIGVAHALVVVDTVEQEGGLGVVDFSQAEGAIKPESYLIIITDGLAPAVNIDDVNRAVGWEIGDKLSLSSDGAFSRAVDYPTGIVVGKIAGPIDAENGTVPLFIDID